FGDEKFIGTLQSFSIPNLRSGTYRMFEVNGDSMLQITGGGLHDGDIVIAQYLENFYDVRDNRVYVVVSKEGIVIKRLINRLRNENPVIVCKSYNKGGAYPDFLLRPEDLFEIWELKAYISKQLSFNTDLWQMLSDMQAQQAVLAEKLANLEKKAS
ncbi:MAG: helix-turn-helix transcriptional regulator, partial [Chryseotalea sp.]